MKSEKTYYIQYYLDRGWHYAKDGTYRIEAGSLKQARAERDKAEHKYQSKARILLVTKTEKVVK